MQGSKKRPFVEGRWAVYLPGGRVPLGGCRYQSSGRVDEAVKVAEILLAYVVGVHINDWLRRVHPTSIYSLKRKLYGDML